MTKLTVASPEQLLAIVPFMIGYHPEESLVIVASDGEEMLFAARHDLPSPGAERSLLRLAGTVAGHEPEIVVLVGYGPDDRVAPAISLVSRVLAAAGVGVIDELRVAAGRFWSYRCSGPDCCPAEGRECPPPDSVMAAESILAGEVALPSRDDLAAQVAPVTGEARTRMRHAERRAISRVLHLAADATRASPGSTGIDSSGRGEAQTILDRFDSLLRGAGHAAVCEAEARYRGGGTLSDDDVAWLSALLNHHSVRDYALTRTRKRPWEVQLWADLVRRCAPDHAAPAASLLGFVAWRSGLGALAALAVDRALDADPGYLLARLLDELIQAAIPPALLDDWPTTPGFGPLLRDLLAHREDASSRLA
jgi:hypothetical protein